MKQEDWRVGDIALCVHTGAEGVPSGVPNGGDALTYGRCYHVKGLEIRWGVLCLDVGTFCPKAAFRFVKIPQEISNG